MTESTGINAWITNSQIVHAVADDPEKPFRFVRKDVVWPVFAHEPNVVRAPTGEYVMIFTKNIGGIPGSQCNPPCKCGHNGTSCKSCLDERQCTSFAPVQTAMSWSHSPNGPWSSPIAVPKAPIYGTNLACIIYRNNTLLCTGQPGRGVLFSPDWKDVNAYAWKNNTSTMTGKDPTIWSSHNESILHMVTHGKGFNQQFGYLHWSDDGGRTWVGTGRRAYDNVVRLVGDNNQTRNKVFSRRERPRIVLDGQGTPIGLTSGVTEGWPCISQGESDTPPCSQPALSSDNQECGSGPNGTHTRCPDDYSYTLFQRLKSA
eukprot:g1096.t1